ncbi:MAG: alpha/beta hydrolase [candidate division KSB1 bacterium]|nr:alpha/beta hydrolase [candidate division KSB1 bacterium]
MEKRIRVNGIELHVEAEGRGEPLLCIPGLGAGNWLWHWNRAALTRHFRCIFPELRGSGRSDKPDERYTISLFAHDMKALMDALGVEQAHVLAASMGGFVAQYMAANWPDRVGKLVLASTSLGGQVQEGPTGDVLSRLIRPRGKTKKDRLEDAYPLNFSREFCQRQRPVLDFITEWRVRLPQPEYAYYRQLLAGNAFDGRHLARKIKAPTLICAGRDDPTVPLVNAQTLKNYIPQSRLLVFEGKHLFFVEHADAFNEAVLAFLLQDRTPQPEKIAAEKAVS